MSKDEDSSRVRAPLRPTEIRREFPLRYSGREFTAEDLATTRQIITAGTTRSRSELSRLICEALGWRKIDGSLKELSCRKALQRMAQDGLVELPPARQDNSEQQKSRRRVYAFLSEPGRPVTVPAAELVDLSLELVEGKSASLLWGDFADRYHYLGYRPMAGAQLRYFAKARGQVLALLAFAAAAWKLAPRDQFIGWTTEQRERNLHLVVGNARFLILPWVQSKNLASRLLGMVARRLPDDWAARYQYRPVLLETFVETERFSGTCYKAANWIHLGATQGRGKKDTEHLGGKPIKEVWVLPLAPKFRETLCK